ncbi:MAG: hypothetical protein ABJB74_08200 [Gemmatimonas sp.]
MYADTLFALERGHLIRLGLWAGASLIAGVLILLVLHRRKNNAPFLKHFSIQMLAWGGIDLALVAWGWRALAYRDYGGSVQLHQFVWLNIGLDAGYVAVGITLAVTGWVLAKRLSVLGAGVGVIVQGFALFVLDLRLLTMIESARIASIAAPVTRWLAS